MKCNHCHKELVEHSLFCIYCGTKVEKVESVEEIKEENLVIEEIKEEISVIEETKEGNLLYNVVEEDKAQYTKEDKTSDITSMDAAADLSSTKPDKSSNKVDKLKVVLVASLLLVFLLSACAFGNIVYMKLGENDVALAYNSNVEKVEAVATSNIEMLIFSDESVTLDKGQNKKLEITIYPEAAKDQALVWESDSEDVRVEENGIVSAIKPNVTANITVKDAKTGTVAAVCKVNVLSEKETFIKTVEWLNLNHTELEKINVYEEKYKPNTRNELLKWDSSLFYKLEDTNTKSDADGLINTYTVEKKQLMNSETGNLMEYEIYSDPVTYEVNKIVSIEYKENSLELIDYYYKKGKVDFIFKREDTLYTPTYASPEKIGERFYFNDDVMVKWRQIHEPLKIIDYVLGTVEKVEQTYTSLSKEVQKTFDDNEIKMINAAYNTYNTVLQAKSIGYIDGYVIDTDGNPVQNAVVKVFSIDYGVAVGEYLTDGEGKYSVAVISSAVKYFIRISKTGYVSTDIYDINMSTQLLGSYQENVYLVPNNNQSYSMGILLYDAFNIANTIDNSNSSNSNSDATSSTTSAFSDNDDGFYNQYENRMVPLNNAQLNIRSGMNNKNGDIYEATTADDYGYVYVTLPAGTYTGEIIKDGYENSYFTIVAKTDGELMQSNTSPVLGEDEVRIVLTWGSTPRDLDSHLFTPYQGSAGDMQHIGYYESSDAYGNNLDVDNTNGYGPETITINNLENANYKYFVADFTNCNGDNYSKQMSLSNAKVSVYTKDGLVQVFNVPRNKEGVIWEVFEIRNKKIIPIQRYYSNTSDKEWWNSRKENSLYNSNEISY